MMIWVDADACPAAVKSILFRAADRTQVTVTLVANQTIPIPPSPYIRSMRVQKGFDVADNEIVARLAPGDLVVTGDIPLAAEVLRKGGQALSPRGEAFSADTIGARLNMRDFLDTLRASGIQSGGPGALKPKDIQAFANALDKFLARR